MIHFSQIGTDSTKNSPQKNSLAQFFFVVGNDLAEAKTFLQSQNASAVMMTFFLADAGIKQKIRAEMTHAIAPLWKKFPPTTFVAQKPCDNSPFIFEMIACAGNEIAIEYFEQTAPSVRVTCSAGTLHFVGDILPDAAPIGAHDRALSAWKNLGAALIASGTAIENLVRTWIYQGHLVSDEKVSDENSDKKSAQRYHELNRARDTFFQSRQFLQAHLPSSFSQKSTPETSETSEIFPASTGIGSDDWDIVLSGLALGNKATIAVPLENPRQVSAFDYAASYTPQSPKFSRAMALADFGMILVSGTASITDSESRHLNNPAAQTQLTLDNIAALIAKENLARHGLSGYSVTLSDFSVARIYIKRQEDYVVIKKICDARLPQVPKIFTFADVCRDELLVEIEGWCAMRK